jgi:hypothetical protein
MLAIKSNAALQFERHFPYCRALEDDRQFSFPSPSGPHRKAPVLAEMKSYIRCPLTPILEKRWPKSWLANACAALRTAYPAPSLRGVATRRKSFPTRSMRSADSA